MSFTSTKLIELGSCAFRQHGATHSHCHLLHGYQLKAKFYFGASSLDSNNWIVDFGGLKELKAILNNQFDHTLCIAQNDPLLDIFRHLNNLGGCDLRIMEAVGIEKTAEWCFNTAQSYLDKTYNGRCWVEKVEVYEHEANSAIFTRDNISSQNTTPLLEEAKSIEETIQVVEPVTEQEVTSEPQLQPQTDSNNTRQGVPLYTNKTNGYSGLFDNINWGSRR